MSSTSLVEAFPQKKRSMEGPALREGALVFRHFHVRVRRDMTCVMVAHLTPSSKGYRVGSTITHGKTNPSYYALCMIAHCPNVYMPTHIHCIFDTCQHSIIFILFILHLQGGRVCCGYSSTHCGQVAAAIQHEGTPLLPVVMVMLYIVSLYR